MSRAQAIPHRLFDRFWPMPGHDVVAGLLPGRETEAKPWRAGGRRHASAETLGRLGNLEVRFARSAAEIRKAQQVRYRVFYREGSALADVATRLARRDVDAFDAVCDHLLVLDHEMRTRAGTPSVVATYRLLQQEAAERASGFYTSVEFEIGALTRRHPHLRFLELGRSCVLAPYRNKRTLELLWHGIWAYVRQQGFDVMIGCASLDGTDPARQAAPLSFLHHYARAPEAWRTQPHAHLRVEMNLLPKDAIDPKAALRALPPLIRGYLRLGAFIGDGAVIDRQFGTTDVLIVLPVSAINARYIEYFSPGAQQQAA
jgi:L-ornithine Nalpha-acyltransferase